MAKYQARKGFLPVRLKIGLFLSGVCFSAIASMFIMNANAKSDTCNNLGQFLFSTRCRDCPAGCYCTGAGTKTLSFDPADKISMEQLSNYCSRKSSYCNKPDGNKYDYKDCGRPDEAKIYRCPDDFPESNAKTTSVENCYKTCSNGNKIYNKKVHCDKGQVLEAGTGNCVTWTKYKPMNSKLIFPDAVYDYPSCSVYKGAKTCEADETPNKDRTACVKNNSSNDNTSVTPGYVKCGEGKFLPAGGTSAKDCIVCLDGYACDGKEVEPSEKEDRGLVKCSSNTVPNKSKSACIKKDAEKEKITCYKGEFLPSNSNECISCRDGSACAGGTFEVKSGDQGIKECVSGREEVSEDKSLCIVLAVDCKPGEYLKAGDTTCRKCEGINKYCPGNRRYNVSNEDQGIYSCPAGGNVNSARSGCSIKISKDFMYFGPSGKNTDYIYQCWSSKNIEEYQSCLFGIID